jgi:hypothetical protein
MPTSFIINAKLAWHEEAMKQVVLCRRLPSTPFNRSTRGEPLAKRGQRDAARELVAPVHGWFRERFDTKDLNNAKALLTDLEAAK